MVEMDDARARLSALEPLLRDAHTAAVANWAKFLEEKPELARPFDATARANFIHCHIAAEVERLVDDVSGVTVADGLGFFGLWVDGRILLRFKFVGHGQPHNVATTQQKLLARQTYTEDMMLTLAGDSAFDPPTLLTCGYTLDGDQVGRIEIRRDCVGHLPWHYDIYGGEAVVQPIVMDGLADTARPAKVTSTKTKKDDAQRADQA